MCDSHLFCQLRLTLIMERQSLDCFNDNDISTRETQSTMSVGISAASLNKSHIFDQYALNDMNVLMGTQGRGTFCIWDSGEIGENCHRALDYNHN